MSGGSSKHKGKGKALRNLGVEVKLDTAAVHQTAVGVMTAFMIREDKNRKARISKQKRERDRLVHATATQRARHRYNRILRRLKPKARSSKKH